MICDILLTTSSPFKKQQHGSRRNYETQGTDGRLRPICNPDIRQHRNRQVEKAETRHLPRVLPRIRRRATQEEILQATCTCQPFLGPRPDLVRMAAVSLLFHGQQNTDCCWLVRRVRPLWTGRLFILHLLRKKQFKRRRRAQSHL